MRSRPGVVEVSERDLRKDPNLENLRKAIERQERKDRGEPEPEEPQQYKSPPIFGGDIVPPAQSLSEFIEKAEFNKQFSGYNKHEVDVFIDKVLKRVRKMETLVRRLRGD